MLTSLPNYKGSTWMVVEQMSKSRDPVVVLRDSKIRCVRLDDPKLELYPSMNHTHTYPLWMANNMEAMLRDEGYTMSNLHLVPAIHIPGITMDNAFEQLPPWLAAHGFTADKGYKLMLGYAIGRFRVPTDDQPLNEGIISAAEWDTLLAGNLNCQLAAMEAPLVQTPGG